MFGDAFERLEKGCRILLGTCLEGTTAVDIRFPPGYPSAQPPSATFVNFPVGFDATVVVDDLRLAYAEEAGEVVAPWIQQVQEKLQEEHGLEALDV
eukprot:5036772-Amphidinium_carterae.1